jgi:hypothetical protein
VAHERRADDTCAERHCRGDDITLFKRDEAVGKRSRTSIGVTFMHQDVPRSDAKLVAQPRCELAALVSIAKDHQVRLLPRCHGCRSALVKESLKSLVQYSSGTVIGAIDVDKDDVLVAHRSMLQKRA